MGNGLSCSKACGIWIRDQTHPTSPALAGRFFTTKEAPRMSCLITVANTYIPLTVGLGAVTDSSSIKHRYYCQLILQVRKLSWEREDHLSPCFTEACQQQLQNLIYPKHNSRTGENQHTPYQEATDEPFHLQW